MISVAFLTGAVHLGNAIFGRSRHRRRDFRRPADTRAHALIHSSTEENDETALTGGLVAHSVSASR